MTLRLRTQLLIGLATLVCILLAGVAVFFATQIGPGALAKLPADRTLAVTVGLTNADHERLRMFLPDAERIPSASADYPVAALIKQQDGTAQWVLFDVHGNPQNGAAVLIKEERMLTDDPAFRGFQSTYTPGTPWVYLRSPSLLAEFSKLTINVPLTVSLGTGSTQISWQNRTSFPTLATSQELQGDDVIFSVHAGNMAMLIDKVSTLLPEATRLAAEAHMRTWVAATTGNEISVKYEILPLFDGPSGITVANENGIYNAILTGEGGQDVGETVAHLHRGVASQSLATSRLTRTFDEKFTVDTLVNDASSSTTEEDLGNWHIVRTPAEGKHGLFSAVSGRRVILSTSDTLIRRMLNSSSTLGSPSIIARGTVNALALGGWMGNFSLNIHTPVPLLPKDESTFQWNLTRKGGILTLELQ